MGTRPLPPSHGIVVEPTRVIIENDTTWRAMGQASNSIAISRWRLCAHLSGRELAQGARTGFERVRGPLLKIFSFKSPSGEFERERRSCILSALYHNNPTVGFCNSFDQGQSQTPSFYSAIFTLSSSLE